MKVVINRKFGGFGLSERAYLWLIDNGVPVKPYIAQVRGDDGKYKPEPRNDGEHITDWDHPETTFEGGLNHESMRRLCGRFHASWLTEHRGHPLLVRCVEALGDEANGMCAKLKVIEVPDGIEWEIDDYDGMESIHETHRSWA